MSLIVALATADNVLIGADSGSYDTDNGIRTSVGSAKLFRQEAHSPHSGGILYFLVGCAGSGRQRQVFQHCFTPPTPDENFGRIGQYMVTQYVPALHEALEEAHALGEDAPLEGCAIIAVYGTGIWNNRPHVFEMMSDLQVSESAEDWAATGANYEIALGVLAALDQRKWIDDQAEEALLGAMHVTARYSLFCHQPFHVDKLIED